MKIDRSTALVLVVSAALMVWYMHFREIDIPKKIPRERLHTEIVERSAPSPYRYRVLMPWMAEGISAAIEPLFGRERALLLAYGVLEAIGLVALALALYVYLASFFSIEAALAGTLFAALTLVVALRDHYFQPWSILDALAFVLSAFFLLRRSFMGLVPLTVLAAFNRETSLFIPLMYLFAAGEAPSVGGRAGRFGLLLVVWVAVYLVLRAVQGPAAHMYAPGEILAKNLSARYLAFAAANLVLLMGGFWVFAALGLKRSPSFIKRLARYVPFYIAAILVFGVWKEVRLLLPLYPVIIPAGLSYLFGRGESVDR